MLKKIFRILIISFLLLCNVLHAKDDLISLTEKLKKIEKKLDNSFSAEASFNPKLYKSFKEVQSVTNMAINAIQNGDIDIALASIDISLKTSKNINTEIPGKYKVQKLGKSENFSNSFSKDYENKILNFSKNMIIAKEIKTLKSLKVIDKTVEIINLKDENSLNELTTNLKNEKSIKELSASLKNNDELAKLSKDFKTNYSLKGTGVVPKNSSQFIASLNEFGIKPIISLSQGTTTTITRRLAEADYIKYENEKKWAEELFGQLKAEDFAISKEFTFDKSEIQNISNEVGEQAKEAAQEFNAQEVADQLDVNSFSIPEEFQKETKEGENPFSIPKEFRLDN